MEFGRKEIKEWEMKWNETNYFDSVGQKCVCVMKRFVFPLASSPSSPGSVVPTVLLVWKMNIIWINFTFIRPNTDLISPNFTFFQPFELTSHLTPWRPIFGRLTLDTSAALEGKLIWKFNIYVNADGIEAGSGILNQYLLFRVWLVTARPGQPSRAPSPVSLNIYVQKKPSRLFIFNCWKLSAILKESHKNMDLKILITLSMIIIVR